MFKLTCPSCKKFLRSATAIPVGRRVKCPGCGTMFEAPAAQAEAPQPAFQPAAHSGYAAGPAPQYSAGGYSNQPPPRPASNFGFDEPQSGGVLGNSLRRPKKKSNLGLILGLVFGSVALVAGVVVAVVLLSRGSGGGAAANVPIEDLLAYIPDKAQFLIGVDANQMRGSSPNWRQELKKLEQQSGMTIPPELVEQMSFIIVGVAVDPKRMNREPELALTFTFNRAYDKEMIKKTINITNSVAVEGKDIHIAEKGMDKMSVAFVSETKVVAGSMDPKSFHALVYGAKPKTLTPDMLAEVNRVKARGFWAVGDVGVFLKDMPGMPDMAMVPIAGAAQMMDAVKNSKAVSFTFDMPQRAGNLSISAAVVCANPADAANLSQSLNNNWNNFKPNIALFGGMPGGANFGPAIDDLTRTLSIRPDGARTVADLTLSQAAIKGLEDAQNAMNPFMGAPGFGPPRVNPVPPVLPKGFQKKGVGKK